MLSRSSVCLGWGWWFFSICARNGYTFILRIIISLYTYGELTAFAVSFITPRPFPTHQWDFGGPHENIMTNSFRAQQRICVS
jgi:hypothetical protein